MSELLWALGYIDIEFSISCQRSSNFSIKFVQYSNLYMCTDTDWVIPIQHCVTALRLVENRKCKVFERYTINKAYEIVSIFQFRIPVIFKLTEL